MKLQRTRAIVMLKKDCFAKCFTLLKRQPSNEWFFLSVFFTGIEYVYIHISIYFFLVRLQINISEMIYEM